MRTQQVFCFRVEGCFHGANFFYIVSVIDLGLILMCLWHQMFSCNIHSCIRPCKHGTCTNNWKWITQSVFIQAWIRPAQSIACTLILFSYLNRCQWVHQSYRLYRSNGQPHNMLPVPYIVFCNVDKFSCVLDCYILYLFYSLSHL